MKIDADSCLYLNDSFQYIASPNCDNRPEGTEITLLVIHSISLPPGEFGGNGVIELFTNQLNPQSHSYYTGIAGLKVSSHFFIRRDGEIIQFVPCNKRAWHAGTSRWRGKDQCNDFSIGIELEGSDTTPFIDAQYNALAALTQCLCKHYPITDIAGHADIAPGRKTDPGPYFDWQAYKQFVFNGLDSSSKLQISHTPTLLYCRNGHNRAE
ncbi:AmpD protein [Nitrosomonas sp. Nm51]|uniref:1,6-anhydro-N-acetylmuramyl-L-alanine amidase AmpD n=1 Tax=Nitrosomonas sp. Nm51 TaxID=133720 RepID=UPI0008C659A1|nr:1,6-anhydro-N-acetylmuramyl-L-alanine amidase AmpD [Nitrosomonas sp. Nm51]SER20058.1 AmpD protein [Nitrosomonas sp. Nm51]